jgi:hypothetical protein
MKTSAVHTLVKLGVVLGALDGLLSVLLISLILVVGKYHANDDSFGADIVILLLCTVSAILLQVYGASFQSRDFCLWPTYNLKFVSRAESLATPGAESLDHPM